MLVVTENGKHSILLRYRVHYSYREFNGAAPRCMDQREFWAFGWCHGIQHNDIHYYDIHYYDIQHNDTPHNNINFSNIVKYWAPLSLAPGWLANIRLHWKWLTLLNTLSYFNTEFIRECKVQPPDVRIRESSEPLADAMTFSIMTFTIMTFNIVTHSKTTFSAAIKSNKWLLSIMLLTDLQLLYYVGKHSILL